MRTLLKLAALGLFALIALAVTGAVVARESYDDTQGWRE